MWIHGGKQLQKCHGKINLFYEWDFPEGSGSNIVRHTMLLFPMKEAVLFSL